MEELKIIISSDVDKGLKGILELGNAFEDLTKITKQLTGQFDQLSKSIPKVGATSGRGARGFQNLSNTAVNANGALVALNRTVQDAPFGFIAIQNNITELFQQFGQLVKQTGSTTAALKAFGASFLGAGGATFAVSALTSGLTALIQKYGDFSTAIVAVTGGLSAAEKAQLAYNDAINKSIGSVQGELSVLNGYLSVARDESISRDQRVKALKEVQKEYPGYLNNINLENINSQKASEAINRLTQALIRKAKVQAAQDLISEEFEKILNAQTRSVVQQASAWSFLTGALKGAGSAQGVINSVISSGINAQNKAIIEAESNIKRFQELINSLLQEDAIAGVIGLDAKSKKSIKTASDILKELQKDLIGIDVAFAAAGGSLNDLSEDKIRTISNALKQLSEVGVRPGSEIFNSLKAQLDALNATLNRTPLTLRIPINIEPLPAASNQQTVSRVMKQVQDNFRKELDPFTDAINQIVNSSTRSGIQSLSEGIGEALVSGDFSSVTKGFVNAIANFGQQLGSFLIAQGVAVQAFNTSLQTLQGIPAIIAGGALIAAAAAFRSLASKGVSSFATGGTVFGPTLAMIGDNPGREEHIVPSEVLDKLDGSWGLPDRIELFLSGTNAVRVLQRGQNYTQRVNG